MYKLPPKYVGAYAEQDAVATLKLWDALKVQLEEQELWHIWNVETDLIPCMLDMRTNGVRVDLDKADKNKKTNSRQDQGATFVYRKGSRDEGRHLGFCFYPKDV